LKALQLEAKRFNAMPIYAYKCESCGNALDVLQKMSDAPLEICPACGKPSFKKQLTAAGFQLKGSGWYATDFKGGNTVAPAAPAASDAGSGTTPASGDGGATSTPTPAPVAKPDSGPAAPAAAS